MVGYNVHVFKGVALQPKLVHYCFFFVNLSSSVERFTCFCDHADSLNSQYYSARDPFVPEQCAIFMSWMCYIYLLLKHDYSIHGCTYLSCLAWWLVGYAKSPPGVMCCTGIPVQVPSTLFFNIPGYSWDPLQLWPGRRSWVRWWLGAKP